MDGGGRVDLLRMIHLLAFLFITGLAFYLSGRIVYSRYTFIKLGKKANLSSGLRRRIHQIIINVLGQKTLLKDLKSGIMHAVMFYGFIILQFGAVDIIGRGLVPQWHLPLGAFYPYFTLIQEFTVFMVMLAVIYAFHRRYIEKLARLKRGWKAGIVLLFIGGLMLSVLLTEGARMVWQGHEAAVFQPAASVISLVFTWMGVNAAVAGGLFYLCWWLHLIILLSFLVYVPQSKHAHIIFAPINIFLRKLGPPGKLSVIDFEDETVEQYGAGQIEHFRQDQLIDLYACVECGRCTNVCPASAAGKMLSPMDLMTKMRNHLTEKGSSRASGSATSQEQAPRLVGDVITEEELWACTTCRNCEDQCPVANEHVDMIIDMRRHLALTEGEIPAGAKRTLNHIERQGNPWGIHRNDRRLWMEGLPHGLEAPAIQEGKAFDYLFFVGSMGSFDSRSIKITRAFIEIMNKAGISFAVLGSEEMNSGDTARRLGNEYLYQELARENISLFHKYKVKKIVTIDPHAFNTFKNEYTDFGLASDVEVFHHTELIARWVQEGRIKPIKEVKERITYHDPCYLGRHNGVYKGPRDILAAIPGAEVVEMERSGSNSMCCGAGGGLMWLEENEGQRVNVNRTEQALELNPTVIGTACPYCLTMMGDGTKSKEIDGQVQTLDIAEIVVRSL
jgi:Fe-S oxidoreductase